MLNSYTIAPMRQLYHFLIIMNLIHSELLCQDHAVLLHGLARSSRSMHKIEVALKDAGYVVHNLDYDSRHHSIEVISKTIATRITELTKPANKVHLVTHSLGGILVRQMQSITPLPKIGRVVMLSPPNHGSEVVDKIGHWPLLWEILSRR